jgi:3-phenylpropionate/cinnamic acid dioxygenase small subunit
MNAPIRLEEQIAVQNVIQQTASLLDAEDLNAWLGLFDATGEYLITAHSTELQRTLTWWKADHETLRKTLAEVPRHVRDPARRLRVVSPAVLRMEDGKIHGVSRFAVFRTTPQGASTLYVVGRYRDTFVQSEDGLWRYSQHHVDLDTRMMDAFTHLPL